MFRLAFDVTISLIHAQIPITPSFSIVLVDYKYNTKKHKKQNSFNV
jgi:hypothetical protein